MNGSTLVIGAGTNLGGRWSILRAARDLVATRFGAAALRVAPVWETPAMGPPQPDYLNCAFAFEFEGILADALALSLDAERALGRERRERWGPRTLDLDLLWHERAHCKSASLTVPHDGLRGRTFALDPLLALVPDAVDPTDGTRLADVRAALPPVGLSRSLGEGFETELSALPARARFTVRAPDRADLLAAAAEALGALAVAPRSVAPVGVRSLEQSWPEDVPDLVRLERFLALVLAELATGRFALRRVAIVEDSPGLTRAVLLGEPLDEARHEVRGELPAFDLGTSAIGSDGHATWQAQVFVGVGARHR